MMCVIFDGVGSPVQRSILAAWLLPLIIGLVPSLARLVMREGVLGELEKRMTFLYRGMAGRSPGRTQLPRIRHPTTLPTQSSLAGASIHAFGLEPCAACLHRVTSHDILVRVR
jgi:hypothetical protein